MLEFCAFLEEHEVSFEFLLGTSVAVILGNLAKTSELNKLRKLGLRNLTGVSAMLG